jgi:hypothetical protein
MSRLGRFLRSMLGLAKPEPTSAALMINGVADWAEGMPAAQDDRLRRALVAADAPEAPPESAAEAAEVAEVADIDPIVAERPKPAKKAAKKAVPRKRKAPAKAAAAAVKDDFETEDDDIPRVASAVADSDGDVWFSDAVAWSLNGRWDFDGAWSPPPDAPRRLEEFREKAAEGKLTIWGRSEDVGSWEPIDAAYWRSCGIEQFSFLEGREKVFTEAKTAKAKNAKYCALKVSRHQVEEVWRGEAVH